MKIKVAICDDMQYICEYFTLVLSAKKEIEVVGIANSSAECIKLVKEKNPDVILLDIQMSTDYEGIDALKKIKEYSEDIKVIILTIHEEDEYIFKCISLGASDYILKSDNPDIIFESIKNVYNGRNTLSPQIAKKLVNECFKMKQQHSDMHSLINSIAKLTAAEYKILNLVYTGHSYTEIAQSRFVEEVTIRTQVNNILKKFEAKNMKELIKRLKSINIFD